MNPHAYDKYTDIYADKKMIDRFIYSFSYLHVKILRDIPIDFLTYILTCTLTCLLTCSLRYSLRFIILTCSHDMYSDVYLFHFSGIYSDIDYDMFSDIFSRQHMLTLSWT